MTDAVLAALVVIMNFECQVLISKATLLDSTLACVTTAATKMSDVVAVVDAAVAVAVAAAVAFALPFSFQRLWKRVKPLA